MIISASVSSQGHERYFKRSWLLPLIMQYAERVIEVSSLMSAPTVTNHVIGLGFIGEINKNWKRIED